MVQPLVRNTLGMRFDLQSALQGGFHGSEIYLIDLLKQNFHQRLAEPEFLVLASTIPTLRMKVLTAVYIAHCKRHRIGEMVSWRTRRPQLDLRGNPLHVSGTLHEPDH